MLLSAVRQLCYMCCDPTLVNLVSTSWWTQTGALPGDELAGSRGSGSTGAGDASGNTGDSSEICRQCLEVIEPSELCRRGRGEVPYHVRCRNAKDKLSEYLKTAPPDVRCSSVSLSVLKSSCWNWEMAAASCQLGDAVDPDGFAFP